MKTLPEKLGHRAGMGTQIWRLPVVLTAQLAPLVADQSESPHSRIAFAMNRSELAQAPMEVAAHHARGGHLWLCYPKKSGRLTTDLTRDIGWESIQALNLYGVSQIALDPDWSALRFRHRDEIKSFTRQSPTGIPTRWAWHEMRQVAEPWAP